MAVERAAWAPLLASDPLPPGLHLAVGARDLPARFLRALAPALARGGGLFWIDAGNGFDAYGFSAAARALGFNPAPLLARVRLARAFNFWQLETLVTKKLPALWRGEPVAVSDILAPFYDEDAPWPQARAAFGRVCAGLKALPASWLILAVEREPPAGRRPLLPELVGLARGWRSAT